MSPDRVSVIWPSIDPFAPKNQELDDATVEAMCAGFLTNPVIEAYRWRVIGDDERADADS